jgi:hypothetical protein
MKRRERIKRERKERKKGEQDQGERKRSSKERSDLQKDPGRTVPLDRDRSGGYGIRSCCALCDEQKGSAGVIFSYSIDGSGKGGDARSAMIILLNPSWPGAHALSESRWNVRTIGFSRFW